MRLAALMIALALVTTPRPAAGQSSATASSQGHDAAARPPVKTSDLPVSLGEIREGLQQPEPRLLRGYTIKPDFYVYIQEREHIQAILNTLDFKLKGIVQPPGGFYAYQQQQVIGTKSSNPLGQPYAAFSGGELITLAIQGLAQRYLGGKVVSAVSAAARSYAEHAAEREVAQAIAEYCAARPDGGESLRICQIEAMKR